MKDMASVTRHHNTIFKTLSGERWWKLRAAGAATLDAGAATLDERAREHPIVRAWRPALRLTSPRNHYAWCLSASTPQPISLFAPSESKRFP